MDIPVPLTQAELDLLSDAVVRARWSDPWAGEGEWLEDIIETLTGEEVAIIGDAHVSRIIRKLIIAVTEARHS
jgi:hypothetical protein